MLNFRCEARHRGSKWLQQNKLLSHYQNTRDLLWYSNIRGEICERTYIYPSAGTPVVLVIQKASPFGF